MRIATWGLILAVAWTVALALIARSPGLHSTPGMWAGAFGLPGVVLASWVRAVVGHKLNFYLSYSIMLLVNWAFYCTVLMGVVSLKRKLLR